MRTHYCGEAQICNKSTKLSAFAVGVNRRRDHGGVIFVDFAR